MRFGSLVVLLAAFAASCGNGGGFFRQYEYEEDMYLSLDGTATIYVNTSVAALNALHGSAFDTRPSARLDRDAIRAYFTTPVTRVTRRPSLSRRGGRRFIHVRIQVDDVRRLSEARPFGWSSYQFTRDGELFRYVQTVGGSAKKDPGAVNWDGREIVAVRLHLPSRILYHNAGADNHRRGNILVWEQNLADRLRGEPLVLEARMEAQSILYRTLFLFGATFLVVAVAFVVLIWWIVRRGAKPANVQTG
jgi:hypothetical protein